MEPGNPTPTSSKPAPDWSRPLRGSWTNESARGRSVFEIRGKHVISRSGSMKDLTFQGPNSFAMERGAGRVRAAQLDQFGRLLWDDGNVWVRHEISEGRVVRCVPCYGTGCRNPYDQQGERLKCPHCFGTGRRSACHPARSW